MKTAEEILKERGITVETKFHNYEYLYHNIVKCMEKYVDQFKYDFSKECKCNDSTGSTWCCNICGLPITPDRDRDKKIIETLDDMDSVAMQLEDVLHGNEGKNITSLRHGIIEIKNIIR